MYEYLYLKELYTLHLSFSPTTADITKPHSCRPLIKVNKASKAIT